MIKTPGKYLTQNQFLCNKFSITLLKQPKQQLKTFFFDTKISMEARMLPGQVGLQKLLISAYLNESVDFKMLELLTSSKA